MQSRKLIRTLIVDDHPLARQILHDVLAASPDITVVGDAASGEAALAQCAVLRPDVVVVDRQMPGMGGVEATRQMTAWFPTTAVLMLTSEAEPERVAEALRAGARQVISKGISAAALIEAIRAAAAEP